MLETKKKKHQGGLEQFRHTNSILAGKHNFRSSSRNESLLAQNPMAQDKIKHDMCL